VIPLRKLTLALRKLGFTVAEVWAMTDTEAEGYIAAYNELRNPKTGKARISKVRRGKGKTCQPS
jgi:hypothetical protein